jgi:hypothetical protein
MKIKTLILIAVFLCMIIFTGCATHLAQKIVPTPIHQAQREIPEDQLLDVGILVFESEELTLDKYRKEGTNPDIRKAERHFMPYHLKNTLHQSSHWGAIQVLPSESENVDVQVKGRIIKSNGQYLMVEIDVMDSAGNTWFNKKYISEASEYFYSKNKIGEKDAFQDLYDTIANDMAAYKSALTPAEIENIRTISKLRFAKDYAPEAFSNYIIEGKKGTFAVNRLPSDDDPMIKRLLPIREREYMFLDTLNQYYDSFYTEMWPSYEDWRSLSLTEQKAMQKIKRDALTRQILGALLMVGAVAAASTDSRAGAILSPTMAVIGGQVIVNGFNVSKQANIHASAIQELSRSFGDQMQPLTVEFEGKQYELKGSAEQQYAVWRELLKKIYRAEIGFDPSMETLDAESP